MINSKEELKREIEWARKTLDESIEDNAQYEEIYQNSIKLDCLIEQYFTAGY